jgi:phosphoribosylamine---glycine ligase
MMKILIIGSGGREHAIAKSLANSPHHPSIFVAPGNAGTAQIAQNVPIKDSDCAALLAFAKDESIDLTIVGPEGPLVLGLVDLFEADGLKIVGPNKVAAQLEGSKDWAKSRMKAYGIPTARYETFTDYDSSLSYISDRNTYPIVVKADGLAAGKGVTVAQSFDEADAALKDCFLDDKFAGAGLQVVIEDFLKGQEASIFAFTDGKTILPMIAAQDHKAVFDGDKGANTGGMGAYAPAPIVTEAIQKDAYEQVFKPLIKGFQSEGIVYKGIVYAGLMIDDGVLSIVEFNARFGDPETQIVLPLMKTDLVDVFVALAEERLSDIELDWHDHSAVCVVMASGGYPEAYEKGKVISGLQKAEALEGVQVVHAGVQGKDGDLVTSGGRVLAVVGQDTTLQGAIDKAYSGVAEISFDGAFNRGDIGAKGL